MPETFGKFDGFPPGNRYISTDMMQKFSDRKWIRLPLFLAIALVFQFCAIRQSPPGGPEDKTPPQVLRTFPAIDSIGVDQLEFLEVEFDESIDPASLRDQIWMMPELPNGFETKVSGGRKLRILLSDSLEDNQTYIVNIGTGVKDYRNNKLESPISLTFSTGNHIDRGEIAGKVLAEKAQDIYILAYPFDNDFSDSIFFNEKARYYTQVSTNGEFRIGYLRNGKYRVFALSDRNRDRIYTLQTDEIGFPSQDVQLDSTQLRYENLNFTMVREDTIAPKIARARSLNLHRIEIQFSEDLALLQQPTISLVDSLSGDSLTVFSAEVDSESPNRLLVFTSGQRETVYLGSIDTFSDAFENEANGDFRLSAKAKEDTVTAKLLNISPADGARNIRYESTVEVAFSHPLDTLSFLQNTIFETADSQSVSGKWRFKTRRNPVFTPDSLFRSAQSYVLRLNVPEIFSVYQQPFGDSLMVSGFSAWDFSELGEIGGTIAVPDSSGQAIIEVREMNKSQEFRYVVAANKPYLLPNLPDGIYQLKAYWDINQNGLHDRGQSLPFEFAEPLRVYPDTVKVRKRWTTDGINLRFE